MLAHLRRSVALSLVLVVLCFAYTLFETGVAQALFKAKADGSLVMLNGKVIGSSELGQQWTGPKWFQGRRDGDNVAASGPENYGPRSNLLYDAVKAQIALLEKEGITPTNGLVTGSGSGLDPDIAYADALAQVNAVAAADHLSVGQVRQLVVANEAPVYLGVFGAPYVNVLQLNLALYALEQRAP